MSCFWLKKVIFLGENGRSWQKMSDFCKKPGISERKSDLLGRNLLFLGDNVIFWGRKLVFLGGNVLFLWRKWVFLGDSDIFLGEKCHFLQKMPYFQGET